MRRLTVTCSLVLGTAGAWAQEPTPDTVVVTATRTSRDIDAVAATVTAKSAEEIEREIARDIRDLVRYEPGVSVGRSGDERFGTGGFSIRGIGGNRVLTLLDGVRVADTYSFGPFLNAGREYVDIDGLKALEIVRGPGSALYGSDALGGIVAFRTKDPEDYLAGEPFYAALKAGYSEVDRSTLGTVTVAAGGDTVSGLLLYTARQGRETENYGGLGGNGPTRELPDPLDTDSDSVLVKLAIQPSDRHRFAFAVDAFETSIRSQVLSDYDVVTSGVRALASDGDDTSERRRASFAYTFANAGGAVDRIQAQVYTQTSEQLQRTRQERLSVASGARTSRWRDSSFDQDVDGASIQVDKLVTTGAGSHYVVVGAELWSTDSASLRDGGTFSTESGAAIPEATPLPTRDFPRTSIDQYGVYVQDEITLLDQRLSISPSLRLDSFDATARADGAYLSGNPGQPPPADFDDSEVSPKIGLLYALTERFSLYAQYAEGFKAPPYHDVNVGFSNPIMGYKTLSNPDLVSERSRSVELGLRIRGDLGRAAIVAFRNTYDDFIESLLPAAQFAVTGGVDPADGLLTFQSQNLEGVQIEGLEVSGDVAFGADRQFALRFAAAYADGTDDATGVPLNSIDPLRGVIGFAYSAPTGRWGGEAVWTIVAGKDPGDIDGNRLATPGYGLLDLLAYWRFAERVQLNAGLFNVTDRRYIEWADTAAIAFSAAMGAYPESARFTRPGFNAGVTLRVQF